MTATNDSILVTPGSGATVATHSMASKEYQAIVAVDDTGHIVGSKDIYSYRIANQVHVAAASTVHFDMFNADAALLVRVLSIKQIPDIVTAVTGVATTWTFQRTTSVGTGGSGVTAWLADLSQTALDADITCRSKPTGGAAAGVQLMAYTIHSEETNAGTIAVATAGGQELIPEGLRAAPYGNGKGILLRQNQGLSVTQTVSSNAGNTAWQIVFSVE